ncbi:LysR family transcriptional regulator [Rhodoferax koreense]|uniref:LysR family transcriptional regulator n=1 Tax=Rhodoferax koreensis TaxID=1842727 RepID=A0A1P8K0Y6_9BURK|nr:LysR family transcriptional regulator [Rhodoferax koreense]APW39668.1 LysR family transcriptional regulator [Rhodoferax koreense]
MKSDHLKETSLRYFLEVARCGSINGASERLCVATSAISRQISGLENALDVQLFERRPRGMVLSAAGEMLATHARRAALEADRVVLDILALQGFHKGHVSLACTEGFAINFLPGLVIDFQEKYPGIHFTLQVSGPAHVSEMVRTGDADIGMTFNRLAQKDIKVEHRQPAPVMVIMRPDHALAKSKSIRLSQLAAHALALPTPESSLRQLFDVACSRSGLLIEPRVTSNCATALHRFVLSGGILSLAGEVSVRNYVAEGTMVAVPLQDKMLEGRNIELQTLVGRTLPGVVKTFLSYVKGRLGEAEI